MTIITLLMTNSDYKNKYSMKSFMNEQYHFTLTSSTVIINIFYSYRVIYIFNDIFYFVYSIWFVHGIIVDRV